jgi:mRNA interferase MazF
VEPDAGNGLHKRSQVMDKAQTVPREKVGETFGRLDDATMLAVGKSSFRGDLWEWRYRPSLDLAPWVDSPTTTTSLDRLDTECGEQLRGLGLSKNDGDDRWWRRSVWAEYTPEQRRSIREREYACDVASEGIRMSRRAMVTDILFF